MLPIILGLILVSPTPAPETLKCITSCKANYQYGQEITECFYEEQTRCHRLQSVCVDSGLVICKPLVVNLGVDNHVSTYYMPAPYVDLTPPDTSGTKP